MNIKIFCIFLSVMGVTYGKHLGENSHGIQIFSVDLDLPPYERFYEIAAYYKESGHAVIQSYLDYFPDWVSNYLFLFTWIP